MGGELFRLPTAAAALRRAASLITVSVLAAALALAAIATSRAAEEDELYAAAERVADLYAMHEATEGEGGETVLSGLALSRQFFHPVTAIAMQSRRLPLDPIYAGGTPPITDIEIFPDTETGIHQGAGFVIVAFKASEEPHRLRYSLVKLGTDDTWWIIDIEGDDWSLKRLLIGR